MRSKEGQTVIEGGRNGGKTADTAYNGTNSKLYLITPDAFFSGAEVDIDAADTTGGSMGVLDRNGRSLVFTSVSVQFVSPYTNTHIKK